jgi:hypothetical protein
LQPVQQFRKAHVGAVRSFRSSFLLAPPEAQELHRRLAQVAYIEFQGHIDHRFLLGLIDAGYTVPNPPAAFTVNLYIVGLELIFADSKKRGCKTGRFISVQAARSAPVGLGLDGA